MNSNHKYKKLRKIIEIWFISLTLFTFFGCSDAGVKIIDYYYVYDHADFNYEGNIVHAQNVLMCKLGCKNDAFIENVTRVEWNQKAIIAKTVESYFVIESNSYGLKCCCSNKIIGPLTEKEVEQYKKKIDFVKDSSRKIY